MLKRVSTHAATCAALLAPAAEGCDDPGFARDLCDIEGLNADVAERLGLIGLTTNIDLLHKAGSATGRNGLATSMRLEPDVLMAFIHAADLTRVGLRNEDIHRLRDAGVETLLKLSKSDPEPLSKRLEAMQSRRRSHDKPTDRDTVKRWIERADELPKMIDA